MRAPVSRRSARDFNRQSQRVTRRSPPAPTLFHPDPSHKGQTSAATFIGLLPSPSPDFALAKGFRQVEIRTRLCTSCGVACVSVEGGGKTSVGRRFRSHLRQATLRAFPVCTCHFLRLKIITVDRI